MKNYDLDRLPLVTILTDLMFIAGTILIVAGLIGLGTYHAKTHPKKPDIYYAVSGNETVLESFILVSTNHLDAERYVDQYSAFHNYKIVKFKIVE